MKKKCNKQDCNLKRYVFAALGVLLIVLLILAGSFLNSERSESEPEELLIPGIKEPGEPELTKLNPNSQIKEGW
jgi:hypothetical protein